MRNKWKKIYDLGCYGSMADVWRRFPEGGNPGEYLRIGAVTHFWDPVQGNWRADIYEHTDGYRLTHQEGDLAVDNDLTVGGRLKVMQHAVVRRNLRVEGDLICRHLRGRDCGLFATYERLVEACPSPRRGDWALVGNDAYPALWCCDNERQWQCANPQVALGDTFNLDAYNEARDVVDAISSAGYIFAGVAIPESHPLQPSDHNVFYLAARPGRYEDFGGIEVRSLSALMWNHATDTDHNGTADGQWTAKMILGPIFVETENIVDGAVTTPKLADLAVTTPKLADGAVTLPKLGDDVKRLLQFRELRFLRTWKTPLAPGTEKGEYALAPTGTVVYWNGATWLGEPFDKTLFYIDCQNKRALYYDGERLQELSATPALKTINGQSLLGEGNIVISPEGEITIDRMLDPESPNAVENREVTLALQDVITHLASADGRISLLEAGRVKAYVIRVWGDDYQADTQWDEGDLWYNEEESKLWRCTQGTAQAPQPTFEEATFEIGALYRVLSDDPEADERWYAYRDADATLVELTNNELFEHIEKQYAPLKAEVKELSLWQSQAIATISLLIGNIGQLRADLTALAAEVHGDTPEPEPEPEPTPQPFDPVACNPGVIVINKDPEDITESDVVDALTFDRLTPENELWLASEYLQTGTSAAVQRANAVKLQELARASSECPGLKIDGEFYVNTGAGSNAANAIIVEKDFTLDGKAGISPGVDGKIVSTGGMLLSTTCSLDLRSVRLVKDYTWAAYLLHLDSSKGTMDLFQMIGCEVTNLDYKARTITVYGNKVEFPLDTMGVPIEGNRIKHFNVSGNRVNGGGRFIHSGGVRVTDSWRITRNVITDVAGPAISLGTTDAADSASSQYAGRMMYMSCPLWIVGNEIAGREGIYRKPTNDITYYCAALVEMNTVYMLHNEIRDFVAGRSVFVDGTSGQPAVYDLYANTTRVFFCNNTIRRMARFTSSRADYGTLKQKGSGIPSAYASPHQTNCMKMQRVYRNNQYIMDGEDLQTVLQYWANRTYSEYPSPTSHKHDVQAEAEYDNALPAIITQYPGIKLLAETTSDVFVPKFLIEGNTFRYPMIEGISTGMMTKADLFRARDNQFISEFVDSKEHSISGYIFSVRALRIEIKDNTFTAKNTQMRLLCNKAYLASGDQGLAEEDITGNSYGEGNTQKFYRWTIKTTENTLRTQYDIPE